MVRVRGGAATRGSLMQFDTGETDAATNQAIDGTTDLGDEDHPLANVIVPVTAGFGTMYCVLDRDSADDELVPAWIVGVCKMKTDADVDKGEPIFPQNASTVGHDEAGAAATSSAVAVALQDNTGADGDLINVLFNGWGIGGYQELA